LFFSEIDGIMTFDSIVRDHEHAQGKT
jgi:hypothetical protein